MPRDDGVTAPDVEISLRAAPPAAELGPLWRALEERAEGSFFQSWTYIGCLMERRFPRPVLLEARAGRETVGLALFNRRRGWLGAMRLYLGESGSTSFDKIFVEHNGPLLARGFGGILPAMLKAAVGRPIGAAHTRERAVVLSGVGDAVLGATRTGEAVVALHETRLAPVVDLAALREAGGGELDRVSANTRYQIRRAERRFAASGALSIRRARDAAEGHRWLEALAALHQRTWRARGEPGAFADANFRRFHHALIDRGLARGEVDLLEVTAGTRILGYLLNFVFHGAVYAYQSGFDYTLHDRHEKPGLACHHLAIEMYLREGRDRYDFLGGAERYKTSFARDTAALHWLTLAPPWSVEGMLTHFRQRWMARAHRQSI